MIDRFLVMGEKSGLDRLTLVLNKIDLDADGEVVGIEHHRDAAVAQILWREMRRNVESVDGGESGEERVAIAAGA